MSSTKRIYTEMVGTVLSKQQAEVLRAHVKAQKTNISAYLKEVAVEPLMAAKGEVTGGDLSPIAHD